jgi:hypothetical protein
LHGGAGAFDISVTTNYPVEPRSGGLSAEYQVIFAFVNNLMNVANASTNAGNVSSSSIGPNPNEFTVNLANVPNGQYVTVTLNTVEDTDGNVGDACSTMGVLVGDANADGHVNASDVAQTKSRIGQPISVNNFRSDVNANGSINATDTALVKSKIGTALP